MSDRELLEKAAKAYWASEIDDVVSIEWSDADNGVLYTHADNQDHNGLDCTYVWNPLTDDGDALRLAVKIVQLTSFYRFMRLFIGVFRTEEHFSINDGCLPTRRAIVRAAAALADTSPTPLTNEGDKQGGGK